MGHVLFLRKGLVHTVPVAFPSGYTRLSYIQSTGTQYIDTGVVANQNISIAMKCKIVDTINCFFFGGEKSYNESAFHLYTEADVYDIGFGTGGSGILGKLKATVGDEFTYETQKNVITLTVNGVETKYNFPENTSFTAPYTTYLFALHRSSITYGDGRIYWCKMKNGDELIRDYIPARRNSDGAIGMIDMVSKTFYPNKGTGAFIAGA